jgi:hypothetical protein
MKTANIEDQVKWTLDPLHTGDTVYPQINGYTGLACFPPRRPDSAPGEIYTGGLPAMLRQGDDIRSTAASQV